MKPFVSAYSRITSRQTAPPGLYVHIPFCLRKCSYCDFYSITDLSHISDYMTALRREIGMTPRRVEYCDTIYIGGGTPSILHPDHVADLLASIFEHHEISPDAEITLEVNPGTVHLEQLKAFRRLGINRLSIGVQSFQDEHLTFLGRIHTAGEARENVDLARDAGFTNISIDLMYGLPGQSINTWLQDLKTAVDFAPRHLSCYTLTFEQGTPMTRKRDEGQFAPLPQAHVADLFRQTIAFLAEHGYSQYEISNFAHDEAFRSRHNRKYWTFAPYIGFGTAAHSFDGKNCRRWNHADLETYMAAVGNHRLPIAGQETLTPGQQRVEGIYLGLRRTEGISFKELEDRFGVDLKKSHKDLLAELVEQDYLNLTPHHCALTVKGMLLLDSIAGLFNYYS